jgi:hypothetical protein
MADHRHRCHPHQFTRPRQRRLQPRRRCHGPERRHRGPACHRRPACPATRPDPALPGGIRPPAENDNIRHCPGTGVPAADRPVNGTAASCTRAPPSSLPACSGFSASPPCRPSSCSPTTCSRFCGTPRCRPGSATSRSRLPSSRPARQASKVIPRFGARARDHWPGHRQRRSGVPGTRRVREASFAGLSGAIPGHNGSVTLVQRAGPPTSPAAHAGEATTEPLRACLVRRLGAWVIRHRSW